MAPKKKRPGERRRQRPYKSRTAPKPEFTRPREWAEQELIGVLAWLERLQGEKGDHYPKGWRTGQVRHYKKRAKDLRAEIRERKRQEKAEKSGRGRGPNVA